MHLDEETGRQMHRVFKQMQIALEADGFDAVDIGLGMLGFAAGLISREAGDFIVLRALDEAKRAMLDQRPEMLQ